ncbi:MAG: 4-hydroxy-3-methylbut-2-enyl diphosphate reductase, partial [Romboutsia timonensis]
ENMYKKLVDIRSKKLDNITFKNTICSATKTRQQAAKELSVDVDCMIVIGGKHSSNTQKLVNICKEQVPTFAIETKEDLDIDKLNKFNLIGVTAGASTPDWIIEDVISFIESL